MKKEARLLLEKAVNSLVLSVEHFNRLSEVARVEGSLIFLDHAFEMLLKAAILHRGGRIWELRAKQTMGFDHCVRKGLTDGEIHFLTKEQALTLQTINGFRDAAYHHLLGMSEQLLYAYAQAGVTLFRDLYRDVFSRDLREELPERVLPVSVTPPANLAVLMDSEMKEMRKLLRPGKRRRIEAHARLRALAILESAIQGEKHQPAKGELDRLSEKVQASHSWEDLFPGVAAIEMSSTGYGASLELRISKKEGVPIQLVKEGTPGASVVAVKRVNELDYYNLSSTQLAKDVALTVPKTLAVVNYTGLQEDPDCFKVIRIGKTKFKRYSPKAIGRVREALQDKSIQEIWETHRPGRERPQWGPGLGPGPNPDRLQSPLS